MQQTERNKKAIEIIKSLVESENERQEMFKKGMARRDGGTMMAIAQVANTLEHLFSGVDLDPYNPPEECPTCHRNLSAEWKGLTKGQAKFLLQMRARVHEVGKNDLDIGVGAWPELSKVQYANVTPLRRFGLVTHVKDENKKPIMGRWLITRNGWAFMRGDIEIPKKVMVWLDRTIDKTIETVSLREILIDDDIPEWTSKDDVLAGYVPAPPEQISLLNDMVH